MATILVHAEIGWAAGGAAAATLLAALALAWAIDLLLRGAERRLAERSGAALLDAKGHTRLRMVRRLVFALIVAAGLFIALLQFESFDRFASAALASGALISAIIGFAARDSLGNALAGIVLAITQPVRFGDVVTIGDSRGTVEDVTLTATWLRTADGSRLIVPNQLVTTSVVRNETIGGEAVAPSASIWIAPRADARSALSALAAIPGADGAAIEESAPGGTRLSVSAPPVPAVERAAAESQLRAAAHEALQAAGIDRAGAP
jgi:small-conductance mechanosensitive channel